MKKFSDLKPFSREWFVNYWFYYRWHTIAALFALVLVAITISEVVNRENPDYQIGLVAPYGFSDEFRARIKEKLENSIDDINNDGKKIVSFIDIAASTDPKDEMQSASLQKLILEFSAGDSFLYIMDKDLFEVYDWQEMFQIIKDGKTYIPLPEIEFFKDTEIASNNNLVLCERMFRAKEKTSEKDAERLVEIILMEN